jgi:hypothetical protein
MQLTLAYDDAVVLFFQRWIDDKGGENLRAHVRNDAELWALNTVSCALEPSIAPLDQNYPNACPERASRPVATTMRQLPPIVADAIIRLLQLSPLRARRKFSFLQSLENTQNGERISICLHPRDGAVAVPRSYLDSDARRRSRRAFQLAPNHRGPAAGCALSRGMTQTLSSRAAPS